MKNAGAPNTPRATASCVTDLSCSLTCASSASAGGSTPFSELGGAFVKCDVTQEADIAAAVKAKVAGSTLHGLSPALAALFTESFTDSPLGPMRLAATAQGLAGLWFDGQAHHPGPLPAPDEPAHPHIALALRELQALRLQWVSCQQALAVAQQSSLEGLPEREMAAALAAFAESHHEQILQVAALEQQIGDFVIANAPDITAHPALSTPEQARPERSRVATERSRMATERSRVVTERSRVVTERSRFSPIREALVKDGLSLEEAEARWPAPPLIP